MEENKNDIDELVKSIDSSFKEMSLKDIVATHEEYFGAASLSTIPCKLRMTLPAARRCNLKMFTCIFAHARRKIPVFSR